MVYWLCLPRRGGGMLLSLQRDTTAQGFEFDYVPFGRKLCGECDSITTRDRMVEVAKIGRMTAHAAGPRARLAENQRRHALARWSWEPSSLPGWLNAEVYASKIQPLLKDIANPVIMSALGVSVTYAVAIRTGRRRPHPRHWQVLAGLAGVSEDGQ